MLKSFVVEPVELTGMMQEAVIVIFTCVCLCVCLHFF